MTQRQSKLRKWLLSNWSVLRWLRLLLIVYLTIGAYDFFLAERQIFQPQPATYQDSREILKLTTSDAVRISALYLPNPQVTYTLLFSHGNGEDLGDVRPFLEYLRSLGFAVFAYDYRGYGTSEGTPSEQNAYRDIEAAYQYLTTTLQVPADRIIVYGRSVGGGPSIDLASRQPVAGLILESTFKSVFRVITQIPLYPFDKFPNIDRIASVQAPILIIHGTTDRTIPFQHGKALYEQAIAPKQFFAVEGAGHNDVLQVAGKRYAQALQQFVQLLQQPAKPVSNTRSNSESNQ